MKNKKNAKAAEGDRGARAANVSEAVKGARAEITSEAAGKCGPAGFFRENALSPKLTA